MTGNKVEFRIEAVDNTSDVVKKVGNSVDGMSEKVKKNGQQISDRAKANQKTFSSMQKRGTAAFLGVAAWGTALAVSLGNTADKLLDLSDITGLTTDTLQEYEAVSRVAWVSQDVFAKAVSGLSRRFTQMEDENSKTSQAMQQLGIDVRDTNGDIKDMDTILMQSIDALGMVENELERNALANEVFGKSYEDLIPIMSLWGDEIERVRQEAREMWLIMDRDALEAANNFRIAQENLRATMGAVSNQIGLAFIPILEKVIEAVQPIVTAMAHWVSENQEIATFIIWATLAIAGLVAWLGTLGLIIPSIVTGFGAVVTAITAVRTAMLFLAANPVGILIAAIAWLAFLVYKYRDEISEAVTKAIDWIRTRIEPFVTRVTDAWQRMSQAISAARDIARWRISEVFGHYLDSLMSFFEAFRALFQGDRDGFLSHMSDSLDSAMQFMSKIRELGMTVMAAIANAIRESIKGQFDNALGWIVSLLETARGWIDDAFTYMLDGISGIARNIMNGVLGIIEGFVNSAIGMLNGLIRAANMIPGINIPMIAEISFGRLAHGGFVGQWIRWGEAVQSFMSGGVVQGNRGVDRVPILASAWELVLNKAQQRNLASHLNGGWGGINIYINGNQFYWDDEQFAEKIGDTLMEKIKTDARFASF